MMMLLRELQDLQMWLLNRGSKLTLAVVFGGEHFFFNNCETYNR